MAKSIFRRKQQQRQRLLLLIVACVAAAALAVGIIALSLRGGDNVTPSSGGEVTATTTHKTLRGPRGGLILCNDEDMFKKINSAIFPGTQGGPLEHIIAAKAIALGEALKPEFKTYQEQIVKNAQVLSKSILAGAEAGTDPIELVACLGYDAGHEGVAEDPLDQTAHLARVAGFEYERADEPPLSQLVELTLTCEEELDFGQMPTLTVTAYYDTGFSRDVTEFCQVSGYDTEADRTQDMEVSYEENGKQITLTHAIRRPINETEAPAPTQTEPAPTQRPEPLHQAQPSIPLWLIAVLGLLLVLLVVLLVLKVKR